jgi:hypothetical protein
MAIVSWGVSSRCGVQAKLHGLWGVSTLAYVHVLWYVLPTLLAAEEKVVLGMVYGPHHLPYMVLSGSAISTLVSRSWLWCGLGCRAVRLVKYGQVGRVLHPLPSCGIDVFGRLAAEAPGMAGPTAEWPLEVYAATLPKVCCAAAHRQLLAGDWVGTGTSHPRLSPLGGCGVVCGTGAWTDYRSCAQHREGHPEL